MVLHEAQAQHLLSDRRQAEMLQSHQARGDLRVEEGRGSQADLPQIRQVLEGIMQEPHVLHARLQLSKIG